MKLRQSDIRRQAHAIPELRFESQSLTSFAGLVMFQQLFAVLDLRARLRDCFRHLAPGKVFGPATIFLQLITHVLLGFRELRDSRAYRDAPSGVAPPVATTPGPTGAFRAAQPLPLDRRDVRKQGG